MNGRQFEIADLLGFAVLHDDAIGNVFLRGAGDHNGGALLLQLCNLRWGEVIASGRAIGNRIGIGTARIVGDTADMREVQAGDVLVTDMTDPNWEPVMKRASAIVTNRGGRTCHAAIIARELGIPAVVGCGDATHALADAGEVTVSCAAPRLACMCGRATLAMVASSVVMIAASMVDPAISARRPGGGYWCTVKSALLVSPMHLPLGLGALLVKNRRRKRREMP